MQPIAKRANVQIVPGIQSKCLNAHYVSVGGRVPILPIVQTNVHASGDRTNLLRGCLNLPGLSALKYSDVQVSRGIEHNRFGRIELSIDGKTAVSWVATRSISRDRADDLVLHVELTDSMVCCIRDVQVAENIESKAAGEL
jgi:hypothetical protein